MSLVKSFIVILLFSFSKASASEVFENFQNTRALGMGNAFSAVVDDHNALWYNPAALDKIRGFHFVLLNMQLGTDALDIYNTFSAAAGGNYMALLQSSYGKSVWTSFSDTLAFAMHGFSFAAYDFFNMSFDLHNPAYSNLNLRATNDYGFQTGFGLGLIPKIWRLGISFKRVTRYGGDVPFGPSSVATLNNSMINNLINNIGTGYGMDIGTLIELPMGLHPTISLVWHDIGQTQFVPLPGSVAPPVMDNEAVAGFSALIDVKVMQIRPAFDFKHLTQNDVPLGMRTHLGLEFTFPGFALRGGFNEGYYTAGFSVNMGIIKVDGATYGVEQGAYPGQTEDRRYIMNFTLDLNASSPFSSDDEAGDGKSPAFRRPSIFQRR